MGKGSYQKNEDNGGFAGEALCGLKMTERMDWRGQEGLGMRISIIS